MEQITSDIRRALDAGHYYVALLASLTLPDICAALESPTGATDNQNRAMFVAWCKTWFTRYPFLTAEDLYYLRCGVVHQGRLGHPKSQYARVVFKLPDTRHNFIHNNIINDALQLDLVTFCTDMVSAVDDWYAAKQNDPNVQKHLASLLQIREHGLSPYITGVPVIA